MINLKLIQLCSAGVNHIQGTPFYKSIPEESDLIVCSASGIHVVPISEHGMPPSSLGARFER